MTINDFYYSDSRAQPLSSFPRQEITMGVRDADGKTLYVTLWLGDTMPENPTREGANNLVYGILIDVENNPTTGKFGVDKKKFNGVTQHDSGITLSLNIPRLVTLLSIKSCHIGFVTFCNQIR